MGLFDDLSQFILNLFQFTGQGMLFCLYLRDMLLDNLFLLIKTAVWLGTVVYGFLVSRLNINNPMIICLSSRMTALNLTIHANGLVTGQAIELYQSIRVIRAIPKVQGLIHYFLLLVLLHDSSQFIIFDIIMYFIPAVITEIHLIIFAEVVRLLSTLVLAKLASELVFEVELEFHYD